MAEYRVIGKPVARVDAVDKVTGAARYAADMNLPGMLWGKFVRSPHPHARIKRIDTSRAEAHRRRDPLRARRRRSRVRGVRPDLRGYLLYPAGPPDVHRAPRLPGEDGAERPGDDLDQHAVNLLDPLRRGQLARYSDVEGQ